MVDIANLVKPLIDLQVAMATLKAFSGMFGDGGGFGGGGNSSSGGTAFIGPLLNKQLEASKVAVFENDATVMDGLTFTSGGATGPEVEALRNQVVILARQLAGFATTATSNATAAVLTSPGANNNGVALAVALV